MALSSSSYVKREQKEKIHKDYFLSMTNYHVIKNKNSEDWEVKKEGAERASGRYDTQSKAEQAAKEFAGQSGGGEVRIHTPEGKIRDTDTVPSVNDPNPPKDGKH
jgi:hypothetical protein